MSQNPPQGGPRPEPRNRLRAALQVLLGQRLVPFQIQSEWAMYQQTFQGQLEQMSAYLARSAKAEKARIERIQGDLEAGAAQLDLPLQSTDKARLRAAVGQAILAGRQIPKPGPGEKAS